MGYAEAGTGELGAAFEVQSFPGGAHFKVLPGREREFAGRAPAVQFGVVVLIEAYGHGGIGDVGHAEHPLIHLFLDVGNFGVQFLDVIGKLAEFGNEFGGVFPGALFAGNFGRFGVAAALERFHLGEGGAAAGVEFQEFIDGNAGMAVGQGLGHHFGLFLKQFEIKHG